MATQTPPAPPAWIRPRQVADRLGVHVVTLWRWTRAGAFPAPAHLGNTRAKFWAVADIEAWEQSQRSPEA